MGTIVDLTNSKFGKWTVLSRAENNKSGAAQWLCKCECGTERIVLGKTLRAGTSTSCGCTRGRKLNLLHQRFGKLVVIAEAPNKTNGRTAWLCQCDCGNTKIVGTKELQNGDTKSCGCLHDELTIIDELGKKYGKLTVLRRIEGSFPDGVHWECKCECGNKIITAGRRLRAGHVISCGCVISRGEALINSILSNYNFNFKTQVTFEDCLTENENKCKFDFGIFDSKNKLLCLIEYDGIQHFIDTNWDLDKNQFRDNIKNEYCQKNNIPLIRIPYTDYEKIDINYINERIKKCLNTVDI